MNRPFDAAGTTHEFARGGGSGLRYHRDFREQNLKNLRRHYLLQEGGSSERRPEENGRNAGAVLLSRNGLDEESTILVRRFFGDIDFRNARVRAVVRQRDTDRATPRSAIDLSSKSSTANQR